jgi:uncharacterized protein (TIGR00299 family) protein
MTRALYFDCFSGCSGDMILGALLDSGFELDALRKGLAELNLNGYQITAEKVLRSSISGTKFNVLIEKDQLQPHRGLTDIVSIIDSSHLSEKVKKKSQEIFRHLGEVEAGIHGIPLDEVHFHELGGIDSIIDIVGAIYVLENLKIDHYYCSPLPVGSGKIKTDHGILPVPAPATLKLLALAGAPMVSPPESPSPVGELVTPTGAAVVTALSVFRRPDMRVKGVGYGAGQKDFAAWPNVMRVWIGEEINQPENADLILLETNIDDMNPQIFGYLMDKLLAERASDVWFTPIQMKKNRPAVMLSILAPAELESRLTEIVLTETSTLGIRTRLVSRHVAERKILEVPTTLGIAHVKVKIIGGVFEISPEYEDCRRVALERGLPLQEVLRIIELESRQYLKDRPST